MSEPSVADQIHPYRMRAEIAESEAREQMAQWMIRNGFTTGHGDSLADLLKELECQIEELRKNR